MRALFQSQRREARQLNCNKGNMGGCVQQALFWRGALIFSTQGLPFNLSVVILASANRAPLL
jgi:hypothetical protein